MVMEYGIAQDLEVILEGPFGGPGSGGARLAEVTLPVDAWKGGESPYSQVVSLEGVTVNSMVNLQLTAQQLQLFHDKDLAFTTVNEEGVVTVYAIGEKPEEDYVFQTTIVEVLI